MKTRLPLVGAAEELSGAAPAAFERAARAAAPESDELGRLVSIVEEPVREAVRSAVPPSFAETLLGALASSTEWARGRVDASEVRRARQTAFAALPLVEEATVSAVEKAQRLGVTGAGADPRLDRHADHVVLRYASLAAHFATSAVCHTLDSLESPALLLEVLRDVVGAHAYQKAGLGSARDPAFRARALEQATWEASRAVSRRLGHAATELGPQIFHEFLGARWRALAAEARAELDARIVTALERSSAPLH